MYIDIHPTWKGLIPDIDHEYMRKVKNVLDLTPEYYPKNKIFRCFQYHRFRIKAVVMGDAPIDSYSNGLAFGTNELAISFTNEQKVIYKAMRKQNVINHPSQFDKSFESWFEKGILMLNCSLTAIEGDPLAHLDLWHRLIKNVVTDISSRAVAEHPMHWFLWSKKALKFIDYIEKARVYEPIGYNHKLTEGIDVPNRVFISNNPDSDLMNRKEEFVNNQHLKILNSIIPLS